MKSVWRFTARAMVVLSLAALYGAFFTGVAFAVDGTFISAPNRSDMVFDDATGILYISSGDSVLRYNVSGGSFLAPWVLGGTLRGLDLSPDGETLVVADEVTAGTLGNPSDPKRARIIELDVSSGASEVATFACAVGEGGAFDVEFGAGSEAFISTRCSAGTSLPLRAYSPLTGQLRVVDSYVPGNCAPGESVFSANKSSVSMLTSAGYVQRIDPSGQFVANSDWNEGLPRGYAIDRGGVDAIALGSGLLGLRDSNNANSVAIDAFDVGFSPARDRLYAAIEGTGKVRMYDASYGIELDPERDLIDEYDVGGTFDSRTSPFGEGRMCFSNDGRRLFVLVDGGIRSVYFPPVPIAGHAYDAESGIPLSGIRVGVFNPFKTVSGKLECVGLAVTDSLGRYEIQGWEDGWYVIGFADTTGLYRDVTWPDRGLPLENTFWVNPLAYGEEINAHLPKKAYLKSIRVQRVWGATRYETAVAACQTNFERATTAIIVSGQQFPDALSASALAGAVRGPLLLVKRDSVPAPVIAELQRLGVTSIYIVGGDAAVSSAVITQLRAAGFGAVTRIAGSTRYATSALVANKVVSLRGQGLAPFICRGDVFPDALSASPYAYIEARPILLVKPSAVSAEVGAAWSEMSKYCDATAILVGGPASITSAVLDQLAARSWTGSVNYAQIYGADRYATCYEVINAYGVPYDVLGLASGENFPDALAGGVACGQQYGPIVLTKRDGLPQQSSWLVNGFGGMGMSFQVFGGTASISDAVKDRSRYLMDSQAMYEVNVPSKVTFSALGRVPSAVTPLAESKAGQVDQAPRELLSIDRAALMSHE